MVLGGRARRRLLAGAILATMTGAGLAVLGAGSGAAATDSQCVSSVPVVAGAPTWKIATLGDSITRAASGDYTWRYFLWRHLVTNGNPSATPSSPTIYDMVGQHTTVLDPLTGAENDDYRCSFDKGTDAMPGVYGSLGAYLAKDSSDPNPLISHVQNLVKQDSANVLIVFAGLEDLTAGQNPLNATDTLAEAKKVAKEAQAAKSDIKILFLTAPQAAGTPAAGKATEVANYNTALLNTTTGAQSWSTATSTVKAVTAGASWSGSDLTYDGIHPNPNGEEAIARDVAAGLKLLGIGPATAVATPTLAVGPRDPSVLAQPSISGTTVNLSWTLPSGSVLAQVQRVDVNAGNGWQNLGSPVLLPDPTGANPQPTPPYTETYADTTFNPAHVYQYRVVAAKSTYTTYSLLHLAQFSQTVISNVVTVPEGATLPTGGTTTPTNPTSPPTSPTATVTATATPPGGVSGFTVTPGVHSAVLKWSPLAGAEGYRFIWFVQGNTGTIYSHDTTATSYPMTGLVAGVTYGFRVRALKSGLQGPLTSTIYKAPKPYALTSPKPTLKAVSKHRIKITWPLVAHATSYAIEIRVKGGKWRLASLTAKGPVTTTSLLKGFTYQVRLQPYDSYAAGAWSAVASIKTK